MSSDRVEITPVNLGKKLGIRPQIIYSLIKRKEIVSWKQKGTDKTVVDEEKATARLQAPKQKRGRKARDPEAPLPSPVKEGDIVSWSWRDGRKVAQVTKVEAPLIRLWANTKQEVYFRYHSLRQLLEEDKVAVEDPWDLLLVVSEQWSKQGNIELAESLRHWHRSHKPIEESQDDEATQAEVVRRPSVLGEAEVRQGEGQREEGRVRRRKQKRHRRREAAS